MVREAEQLVALARAKSPSDREQLMLSLGICVGALALRVGTLAAHRDAPGLTQFRLAFVAVTAVSLTATIWNARFSATAGDELAGRAKG